VSTATVAADGTWKLTISLSHGTYKLSATQTDAVSGLTSAASASVTVTTSH
jgi:hypothetical protein